MKKLNDERVFYISAGVVSLIAICLIALAGVNIYKRIPQDKTENNNISVTESSSETETSAETEAKIRGTETDKFCGVDVIYID